jgi:hypothetical protein
MDDRVMRSLRRDLRLKLVRALLAHALSTGWPVIVTGVRRDAFAMKKIDLTMAQSFSRTIFMFQEIPKK